MNEKYPLALPEGSILAGQYIIGKVLGQGGFGITYEARDYKTNERVAVKEFFPDAMATRTNQTTVSAFSGERGESFAYGKTCFLQEAETLARFIGNENIVRIHSYFEENETAYFVMDFIEGTSFDEYLKQQGGKIPYEEAAQILIPVMDALSAVHSQGIVHRDVTPDNIYITKEGVVKLLDFGAARYTLGDKSRSLDIILKHGFAPKEQYTRRGKQGPYTDVYALGATFYFALTGRRPPDSVERLDEDDLVPPSSLGVQISNAAEDAILRALSVQPGERFQSMMAFKNALYQSQQPAAVGSRPVSQIYFNAPDQTDIPHSGMVSGPTSGAEQEADLQNLAATMKTAGKLAGKLAGKMAGKVAEKTAETAGVMAGTAGKMSEIMAAKKAETAEKLAAKMAEREAEKAAREAERATQQAAAEAARGAAENEPKVTPDSTVGHTGGTSPDAPPGAPLAKPRMNKKLFLIPAVAAIAVVLIGVFALKLTGGEPSADVTPTERPSASVAPTKPPATPRPTATPEPTAAPTPTPTPEPAYTLSGEWSVIGNYAGNIMNGGIRSVRDVTSYYITAGRHSLWHSTDNSYIGKDYGDGVFSDLSVVDGGLYFLYDGYMRYYDFKSKELDDCIEVNEYFGGSILHLLLTKDFYVICCQNSDGTATVYRVLRATGEYKVCCTTEGANTFTMSDDGWIYYIDRGDDNTSGIYRTRLDTLEPGSGPLLYLFDPDFALCNPIVVGDFLYVGAYNTITFEFYEIVRIDRKTGYQDTDPAWNISSELKAATIADGFGFNVSDTNNFIYFYIYTSDGGGNYVPNLYQIVGHDDGTFDMKHISSNSYNPNFLYYTNGSYQVIFYHRGENDSDYLNYYQTYDVNGNRINTNN